MAGMDGKDRCLLTPDPHSPLRGEWASSLNDIVSVTPASYECSLFHTLPPVPPPIEGGGNLIWHGVALCECVDVGVVV